MGHAGIDDLASGHCANGIYGRPRAKVGQHHPMGQGVDPYRGMVVPVENGLFAPDRCVWLPINRSIGSLLGALRVN